MCWRWANCDTKCSVAVRTSAMSAQLGSSEALAIAARASTRRNRASVTQQRFRALHLRQHDGRIGVIHHRLSMPVGLYALPVGLRPLYDARSRRKPA